MLSKLFYLVAFVLFILAALNATNVAQLTLGMWGLASLAFGKFWEGIVDVDMLRR